MLWLSFPGISVYLVKNQILPVRGKLSRPDRMETQTNTGTFCPLQTRHHHRLLPTDTCIQSRPCQCYFGDKFFVVVFCPGKKYVYHCIFTFHISFISSHVHHRIFIFQSCLYIYLYDHHCIYTVFCFICSPLYFNISVISSSKNLYEHETVNIWVRFPGRKTHTQQPKTKADQWNI